MQPGDFVQVRTGKGRVLLAGRVTHYERDDGCIGNPESFLRIQINDGSERAFRKGAHAETWTGQAHSLRRFGRLRITLT